MYYFGHLWSSSKSPTNHRNHARKPGNHGMSLLFISQCRFGKVPQRAGRHENYVVSSLCFFLRVCVSIQFPIVVWFAAPYPRKTDEKEGTGKNLKNVAGKERKTLKTHIVLRSKKTWSQSWPRLKSWNIPCPKGSYVGVVWSRHIQIKNIWDAYLGHGLTRPLSRSHHFCSHISVHCTCVRTQSLHTHVRVHYLLNICTTNRTAYLHVF